SGKRRLASGFFKEVAALSFHAIVLRRFRHYVRLVEKNPTGRMDERLGCSTTEFQFRLRCQR
ncbi:MAG TPA: hypothetical protein VEX68_21055, partial [Bryobacteraceae bacterium]|nr:hypothetical protein [Bryobacteraceae bacterium]